MKSFIELATLAQAPQCSVISFLQCIEYKSKFPESHVLLKPSSLEEHFLTRSSHFFPGVLAQYLFTYLLTCLFIHSFTSYSQ